MPNKFVKMLNNYTNNIKIAFKTFITSQKILLLFKMLVDLNLNVIVIYFTQVRHIHFKIIYKEQISEIKLKKD